MSRTPVQNQEGTNPPPGKKGRSKTRPKCYGCDARARAESNFCSDKCGAAYADELIAGNGEEWCSTCDRWENPTAEVMGAVIDYDKTGNVLSERKIFQLSCGHKSSGVSLSRVLPHQDQLTRVNRQE